MRKNKGFLILIVVSLLLSSCAKKESGELPTPQVQVSAAPEVDDAAASFLGFWDV